MKLRTGARSSGLVVFAVLAGACSSSVESSTDAPVAEAASAFSLGDVLEGKRHFDKALPGTNGRSCATCHVEGEHFVLTPQHAAAVYAQNPGDPLFNPIDADDPTAATPTYEHLKAGLVRVTLKLADNLDVVDGAGNVITNADRTIWVWRAVPTVENVAATGPYQADSRETTLESQARSALLSHSQINHDPSAAVVEEIADFERVTFSSFAAAAVADAIEDGRTPAPLDLHFPPGSDGAAGQALFKSICAQCHGGPTTTVPTKAILDESFPVYNPDGTINLAGVRPNGIAIPAEAAKGLYDHHDINTGIPAFDMLRQLGVVPNPTGLDRPHYRIRFYADATRTQKRFDLPPVPPGIGDSLLPQPWSVDPGRAIISGDPVDWESFKIPQLRGIANTAPYFHNGSAPDLRGVLDQYSRFILPVFPSLDRPLVFAPEGPGLPPESLSSVEKTQLLAFLQKL